MQGTGHPASVPETHREGSLKKLCHCDCPQLEFGLEIHLVFASPGVLVASLILLGTVTSGKDFPSWHLGTALERHCGPRLWGAVKTGRASHHILCGAWCTPQQATIAGS